MTASETQETIGWHERVGRWLYPLGLCAIAVIAYANSFACEFLFDDIGSILTNPQVTQFFPVIPTDRFITDITFKLNYAVGGFNVADYHAVNLLIHLLAGLTLYGVIGRTLRLKSHGSQTVRRSAWMAFCCAALWLAHPLQTESVTYLCQRYEALMGLFLLVTLYAYVRAVTSVRKAGWYVVSVLACALGMGAKCIMVCAPFIVLCYDYVFVAEGWRELWRRRGVYFATLFATLLVLVVLVGIMVRAAAESGTETMAQMSPLQYLGTQFGVIAHYLRLCVWPHPLCLDYAWPLAVGWQAIVVPGLWVTALGLVAVGGFLRRKPWGFLGVAFFFALGPSSSVLPIADLAFEHRMYLPLATVICLVVGAGEALLRRGHTTPVGGRDAGDYTGRLLFCLLLVLLMGLTIRRNRDYRTPEAMWRTVIAQRPENYRQHLAYVQALLDRGAFEESRQSASELVEKTGPARQAGANGRGIAASDATKFYPMACNAFGRALLCQGHLDQAAAAFERALSANPDYKVAHYNLAVTHYLRGDVAHSLKMARWLSERYPHYGAPNVLAGKILLGQGQYGEALASFDEAGSREAASLDVECSIAWLLATSPDAAIRDGKRAVVLARKAVKATGQLSRRALDIYAAALAETGQFDRAGEVMQAALQLPEQRDREDEAERGATGMPVETTVPTRAALRQRAELYSRGMPYRLPVKDAAGGSAE